MKRVATILALLLFPLAAAAQEGASKNTASRIRRVTFAQLGTPSADAVRYCTDCAATAPCTGSGGGAFAFRVGTNWNCTSAAAGGGSGDVVGPASSTTNGVAVFSDTTGKLLGSRTATIDASNNLVLSTGSEVRFSSSKKMGFTSGVGPYWIDNGVGFRLSHYIQALSSDRTATWPNADGAVVLDVAVQTLSYKTLTMPALTHALFAELGTPVNGTYTYCSDCTETNPCADSGTGAFAKRINDAWDCN